MEKSIELSESFHFYKYILQAKTLLLDYYYVVDKNSDKALHFLETEPEGGSRSARRAEMRGLEKWTAKSGRLLVSPNSKVI